MDITKPKRKKKTTDAGRAKKAKKKSVVRLNVDVPRDVYTKLRNKTFEQETTISAQINTLIRNYVAR